MSAQGEGHRAGGLAASNGAHSSKSLRRSVICPSLTSSAAGWGDGQVQWGAASARSASLQEIQAQEEKARIAEEKARSAADAQSRAATATPAAGGVWLRSKRPSLATKCTRWAAVLGGIVLLLTIAVAAVINGEDALTSDLFPGRALWK